jgi:hypothetical protein
MPAPLPALNLVAQPGQRRAALDIAREIVGGALGVFVGRLSIDRRDHRGERDALCGKTPSRGTVTCC